MQIDRPTAKRHATSGITLLSAGQPQGVPGASLLGAAAEGTVKDTEAMTKLEIVQEAINGMGDASAEELTACIEQTYGVRIAPRFIPVFKASVRDKELLVEWRRKSQAAAQTNGADPFVGPEQPKAA